MTFVPKEWKARISEFATRRKLKIVSQSATDMTVDVSRSEGLVSQPGDAFSPENMNDLEQRIKTEFEQISAVLDGNRFGHTEDGRPGWKEPGADTVIPFSRKPTVLLYGGVKSVPQTTKFFDLDVRDRDHMILIYDSFSISGSSDGDLKITDRESGNTLVSVSNSGGSQYDGSIRQTAVTDIHQVNYIVGTFNCFSHNGTSNNKVRSNYCLILY